MDDRQKAAVLQRKNAILLPMTTNGDESGSSRLSLDQVNR